MAREAPRRPHLPPDTGTLRIRLLRELPVLNAAGGYARVLSLSVSPDVHGGAYGGGLPCLSTAFRAGPGSMGKQSPLSAKQ